MQDIVNIYKALSDETRLRIIKLLAHGELCVCDIVASLDIIQPKISFHLGVLKEAGLVKDRRVGKWIHYRLDDSEIFRRFLLLSTIEKAEGDLIHSDKMRLEEFLKSKEEKIVPMKFRNSCCRR
jgi:ArsR family transcriptional regulator, arsenate/arsenite/antimonite-responsive transcriptional repressor